MKRFVLLAVLAFASLGCVQSPPNVAPTPDATIAVQATAPPEVCRLYQNQQGKVACFGCGKTVCTTPEAGFEPYDLPQDYIGVPYACYVGENGCELAQ